MKMKRAMTGFLSGLFLLGMVSQVQAVPVTYNVNGTFDDGGTLMGTIDIDSAGPPFVTDFDLTTAGGGLSGFNYVLGGGTTFTFILFVGPSQNQTDFTIINAGFGRSLNFGGDIGFFPLADWNPTLNNLSPTYTVDARERVGISFRVARNTGAVATPEPGTILLFGSGLLGLGLWRYRKNVKN